MLSWVLQIWWPSILVSLGSYFIIALNISDHKFSKSTSLVFGTSSTNSNCSCASTWSICNPQARVPWHHPRLSFFDGGKRNRDSMSVLHGKIYIEDIFRTGGSLLKPTYQPKQRIIILEIPQNSPYNLYFFWFRIYMIYMGDWKNPV